MLYYPIKAKYLEAVSNLLTKRDKAGQADCFNQHWCVLINYGTLSEVLIVKFGRRGMGQAAEICGSAVQHAYMS